MENTIYCSLLLQKGNVFSIIPRGFENDVLNFTLFY